MSIKLFKQQVFKNDKIIQNWYHIDVKDYLLTPQNETAKTVKKEQLELHIH